MPNYYKIATHLISPFVPLWLRYRAAKGKEEKGRIAERYGHSHYARPEGTLLWIHAASVGEANSVLVLIYQLKERFPKLNILLTTGTVTSAQLMKKRLPAGVLHHYAPVDTPEAAERFIKHWLPDVVWFVESELWPNLIEAARDYYCLMALINARMSERSFYFWQKYINVARDMISAFRLCFAQSEIDAARLRILGAPHVITTGNLKYDAPLLPCNESELLALQNTLAGRPVWLAASTHPGEEALLAKTHLELLKQHPNLLAIIVPRHPDRGAEVARELSAHGKVSLRSQKQAITNETKFYVADTLGELGLFYRASDIVFLGGSLVEHGGQNPLEPAQLACAILSGPHKHNFIAIYHDLEQANGAIIVQDERELAQKIASLLTQPDARSAMQARAKQLVISKAGASQAILDIFAPVFAHEHA